jgi:Repeat of unknown function (DUF5648)
MHDLTRRFAIAGFAGFLALLPVAGSVSGQSIEPYYADTSSYEAPAFLIKDMYALPISTCLTVSGESVEVEGSTIRFTLEVRPFPSCNVPGGRDLTVNTIVGLSAPLAAGAYTVEFGYLIDGDRVFRKSMPFVVDDGIGKCGRLSEINTLLVTPSSGAAFERIATVVENPSLDPGLFEILGRPIDVFRSIFRVWLGLTYAPLDDQQDIKRRIDARKVELGISSVDLNGFVCSIAMFPPIEIVEFYNTGLGHYFMTEDKAEIASIENGGSGPGWQRTGERITGRAADPCLYPAPNSTPLYRFYGTRGIGPNSHFFTVDRQECGAVRRDPGWTFESVPLRIWAPTAGACPSQSLPVHRLYNGRAAQNDSNHRYTSRQAVIDTMVAAGWTHEGVTLCVPQP